MFDNGAEIHMLQPITGHAWKKTMRAKRPLVYDIESIPEPHLIFNQMVEWAKSHHDINVTNFDNYHTWNMGLGYVIIAPQSEGDRKSTRLNSSHT